MQIRSVIYPFDDASFMNRSVCEIVANSFSAHRVRLPKKKWEVDKVGCANISLTATLAAQFFTSIRFFFCFITKVETMASCAIIVEYLLHFNVINVAKIWSELMACKEAGVCRHLFYDSCLICDSALMRDHKSRNEKNYIAQCRSWRWSEATWYLFALLAETRSLVMLKMCDKSQ